MTTRLDLYNKALLACGERFLSALTDANEPRRLLDHVWDTGWVRYCLEQGAWQFAMRTTRIEVDADFSAPDFGYQNAFSKPEDWVSTWALCSDEYFRQPLNEYVDEVGHWFANIEPIYVQMVSSDETYGGDLSLWPESFADYAANYGASKIISKLGDKAEQAKLLLGPPGAPERGALRMSLHEAKSKAARTQPARFPAQGAWVTARRGRTGSRYDRGNSGSLIG